MNGNKWILGLKVLLGIIVILNLGFIGYTYINKRPAPTPVLPTPTKATEILPTPNLLGKLLVTATPTPTPTPTPALVLDTKMGNNYYAAKYANDLSAKINSLPTGALKGLYVYFDPVDIGGKSQYEYYASALKYVLITLQFDAATWEATPADTKKTLITSLVKTQQAVLNIYPHVVIMDEVKSVAKGDWNPATSSVTVTLQ